MILRASTLLHLYSLSATTPTLLSRFSHSFLSTSAPSPPIRLIWLNQSYRCRTRALSSASVSVSSPKQTGGDIFFAEETVSWKSLGLSDRISQALFNAGFDRPSLVQAACMLSILSGKDVVIAAETGSGKTYGYLVPLIDKLCSAQHDGDNDSEKPTASSRSFSVVLCPNVLLCEQVVRMANDLSGDDGKPLLRVAAVCGRQGWPVNEPDIIVSTPVALLNNIDPKKQHRSDFVRAVKLKEKWIDATTDTQVDVLIEALKQFDSKSLDHGAGVSRTMVFGNTVEAVEAVANILQRAEIECYRYHKDLSLEERAESLDGFREKGGIFVCTDAAARGVDIPNVSHIIQADFATSAVDFLHRVGRTAQAAGKLGQPVEPAFSRKRSFWNKLKKRAGSNKARDAPTAELMV
ncbi:DEAD-box ATP-dependent RNA helicase 22 [Hibiscus syriacus]|uniref:ATP-dependent RNA helicase n=1 Tax=Hibiscus syriacus TaxID=106335 RepID=A0A6A3BIN2_HIBSY|nr:DEAD-box ATP-dependent RNA helicase 22 [Hibiscus syriacus]